MNSESLKRLIDDSKNLHLLYVEDDTEVSSNTVDFLNIFFDDITLCGDGEEGLKAFSEQKFDLIITDINMVHMSGLEMIRIIKKTDDTIPVFILSAYDATDYLMESIDLDIDAYMQKPLTPEVFTSKLKKAIETIKATQKHTALLNELNQLKEIADRSSIVSKTDPYGNITYVNNRFCEISGYSREELLGKSHNIIRHPDMPASVFEELWQTTKEEKKPWFGQIKNRTKSGKSYYVDSVVNPVLDEHGNVRELIAMRYNVTDLISQKQKLFDEIERMPEPMLLIAKIEEYEVLKNFYDSQTIQSIENKFEEDALNYFLPGCKFRHIYALGEGQYAFLKDNSNPSSKQEQENDLKIFQHNVKGGIVKWDEYEYDIRITLSYATQREDLFKDAMLGLEHALKIKSDFICADGLAKYEQEQASKNIATIKMIQKAISEQKIILFFQPIVNNKTGQVDKYESLVRLIDGDEVISPAAFLDIAKKGKYYRQITDIVISHSFKQLISCDKEISINLSAVDIEEERTREKIISLLEIHKEHAHRIIFELLEDEGVKDFSRIKAFIHTVKTYGAQIAIDDFGSGYSNFERILDYQPDIIKIDGTLIRNIDSNQKSFDIVETIYTFASKLGIQTVAEFVSSKQIYDIVSTIGIDYSQGYYFGKPEPLLSDQAITAQNTTCINRTKQIMINL